MRDLVSMQVGFGREVLGPIFYDFCRKLYLYQSAHKRDAICLFAYRGGARLLYLYQKYLKSRSLDSPIPQTGFLISRILSLKAAVWDAYDKAEKLILREYRGRSVEEFVSGLCTGSRIDLSGDIGSKKLNAEVLREIFFGSSLWARDVQRYLRGQRSILKEYVDSLVGTRKKILFVDTGWSGTTQYFLMKAFPEYQWEGVYFGKWDTWKENPSHFYCINGISVEGTTYDRRRPQTAVFQYHHIIESPLEPNFPSVEHLGNNGVGSICPHAAIDRAKIPPQANEPIFKGICDFFDNCKEDSIAAMSRQVYNAWGRLRKMILYPTPKDVKVMTVPPRSTDFGRKTCIPVLAENSVDHVPCLSEKLRGIQRSIWKQGKVVEEFPIVSPVVLFLYNFLALYLKLDIPRLVRKLGLKV